METLTRQEVVDIVGHISDVRIAEIIATGASAAQVAEAFAWLSEDEYLAGELEKQLSGVVERVYEILRADEPDWEEDRISRP